jgi:DnaJ-domain-containing protein 1
VEYKPKKPIGVEQTRQDIRQMFDKWNIDRSEFEIDWQEEKLLSGITRRLPGVTIRYLHEGKWQTVSCLDQRHDRAWNLRQVFFFLDRIRMAEKVGVQYENLSYSTDVAKVPGQEQATERDRKENLIDAYDILGAAPDDPVDLVKDLYKKKAGYYHPDKGGDPDKFKRLQEAYDLIMASRGQK